MAVHDGHRERMRQRIETYGIQSLQDHEVLEYLLYAVVPRKDTNELAHRIIEECGSLSEVFDQSVERLQKIKGVTYNAALFLSSLSDISRRYYSKNQKTIYIRNVAECLQLMRPIMETLTKEEIHLLLIDSAGKLIKRVVLSKGVVNESVCNVRDVVDIALKNEACRVVLVHNHPSNNATPSLQDKTLTEQVCVALSVIGIILEDHIIIAKGGYFSFKDSHWLENIVNGQISLSGGKIKDIRYWLVSIFERFLSKIFYCLMLCRQKQH